MKKRFNILFLIIFLCQSFISWNQKKNKLNSTISDTLYLNKLINQWHLDAANTKLGDYFGVMTDNFVFLGTAPGERWNKDQFYTFCKPYFDKGKAWDFKPTKRNWVFTKDRKMAWFDEDLDTWMMGCRGSGICILEKGVWKIAYYNLTVLIENEKIQKFIDLRKE